MNKSYFLIIQILFFVMFLNASDKDIKAVLKAKMFYKSSETVKIDGSKSDIPKKSKKVQFSWSVKDENGTEYTDDFNSDKVELTLNEGKYIAELTVKSGKKISTDKKEFVVADKQIVKVTVNVIPPVDTPDYDYIFLGHEIENHKEWVPYATMMNKAEDGKWIADFSLETGKIFKFQPTRGSWGTKGRDKNDSDYIINYLPFRDESITVTGFSWGKIVDNEKLLRQPLLVIDSVDYSKMKVLWKCDVLDLYYGEVSKAPIKAVVNQFAYGSEAILDNLSPGKNYFYKVGVDGESIFFTTPDNDGSFVFAAGADGQNIKSTIEASANKIMSYKPSLIVLAGDMVNNGLKVFSWDLTFFKSFVPFIKGVPLAMAPGNHEEGTPLFNRFLGQTKNWKTFVHENSRFVMLDVESTYVPGSEQYKFIEKTLKENTSKWLIVVMHESPFAFIPRHYSNLLAREHLTPLFEKYKVNLVLAGHNHVYERIKPINNVTYVTLPCLGSNKPKEAVDPQDPLSAIQVFNKDGFAIVNVDNTKMVVKVETPTGELIDSFIINSKFD